jgi:hypothetical protein
MGLAISLSAAAPAVAAKSTTDDFSQVQSYVDGSNSGYQAPAGTTGGGRKSKGFKSRRAAEDIKAEKAAKQSASSPSIGGGGPSGPPDWNFFQDFLPTLAAPSVEAPSVSAPELALGSSDKLLGLVVGGGLSLSLPALAVAQQVNSRIEEKKREEARRQAEEAEFQKTIGSLVGAAEGAGVGSIVGPPVGINVGLAVGRGVGILVGDAVGTTSSSTRTSLTFTSTILPSLSIATSAFASWVLTSSSVALPWSLVTASPVIWSWSTRSTSRNLADRPALRVASSFM